MCVRKNRRYREKHRPVTNTLRPIAAYVVGRAEGVGKVLLRGGITNTLMLTATYTIGRAEMQGNPSRLVVEMPGEKGK